MKPTGTGTAFTGPATTYFVAAVRFSKDGTRHLVCSTTLTVSGRVPLTKEEAIGRFKAAQTREWDAAKWGPESDWILREDTAVVSAVTTTPGAMSE